MQVFKFNVAECNVTSGNRSAAFFQCCTDSADDYPGIWAYGKDRKLTSINTTGRSFEVMKDTSTGSDDKDHDGTGSIVLICGEEKGKILDVFGIFRLLFLRLSQGNGVSLSGKIEQASPVTRDARYCNNVHNIKLTAYSINNKYNEIENSSSTEASSRYATELSTRRRHTSSFSTVIPLDLSLPKHIKYFDVFRNSYLQISILVVLSISLLLNIVLCYKLYAVKRNSPAEEIKKTRTKGHQSDIKIEAPPVLSTEIPGSDVQGNAPFHADDKTKYQHGNSLTKTRYKEAHFEVLAMSAEMKNPANPSFNTGYEDCREYALRKEGIEAFKRNAQGQDKSHGYELATFSLRREYDNPQCGPSSDGLYRNKTNKTSDGICQDKDTILSEENIKMLEHSFLSADDVEEITYVNTQVMTGLQDNPEVLYEAVDMDNQQNDYMPLQKDEHRSDPVYQPVRGLRVP